MNDTSTVLPKSEVTAPNIEDNTNVKTTFATTGNSADDTCSRTVIGDGATSVEATKPTTSDCDKTQVVEGGTMVEGAKTAGCDEAKTVMADTVPSDVASNVADDAPKHIASSDNMAPEEESDDSGVENAQSSSAKKRTGKLVAGAIGGVLLGSAAAYAAIHGMKSDSSASSGTNSDTDADATDARLMENQDDKSVEVEENEPVDYENDSDILSVMEDDGEEYVDVDGESPENNNGVNVDLGETIADDATVSHVVDNGVEDVVDESGDEYLVNNDVYEPEPTDEPPVAEEPTEDDVMAEDGTMDSDEGVDLSAEAHEVAKVSFASDVNDEMSFNQAFAAARAEVGAGGVFEWRGNIYGTYYADEWNEMSDDEKVEFNRSVYTANDDSHDRNDDVEVVADEDIVVDILDDIDDDAIEVLGISSDDDSDIEISLLDDDDNVVYIDVDTLEDDVDLIVDVAEDDVLNDDFNVVENLCDDADDMAWSGDDIFS